MLLRLTYRIRNKDIGFGKNKDKLKKEKKKRKEKKIIKRNQKGKVSYMESDSPLN